MDSYREDEDIKVLGSDMDLIPKEAGKNEELGVETNNPTVQDDSSDTITIKNNDVTSDVATIPSDANASTDKVNKKKKKKKDNKRKLIMAIAGGALLYYILKMK